MSKPTFVFVPGGSHLPQVYDGVRASLSAHDYNSIVVPLPSVGGKPPIENFTEDVVAIRDAVNALVEQEQDVIVVLHSYSRIPGGEALDESLGKNGREANGLKGGVMRLVYVTAALVPEGFQGGPKGDISFMAPFMECDLEDFLPILIEEDVWVEYQIKVYHHKSKCCTISIQVFHPLAIGDG